MAAAPPAIIPVFTVYNAMVICGCDDAIAFNGATQAERIATDIFDDNYESCIDKSYDDLDEDLKSYSVLTVANGQIRLKPRIKKNIKAFIQWSRDKIRIVNDPSAEVSQ